MNLRHVVITSVNRDDLPDDGAGHWAETVRALREALPESLVEVLTPDFRGKMACVETVLDAGPHVFNHNIEMAPGLFRALRPGGDYRRSLDVLAHAADYAPRIATKSGLMVGFGESLAEVRAVLEDLREHGVSILTIGQYIQPSPAHAPVVEFVRPEQFEDYRTFAEELGFAAVASGPFVRSSYQAEQTYAARRV
jgi:lipoic acid synthetase